MNVQIHAVHTGAIDDLEPRVRADVEHALRGFEDRVTNVTVHLRDTNGAKGGPNDKRVTVEAHLAGLPALAVTAEHSDMSMALTNAMTKLEAAARHRVGRQS